jgi:Protein of unknown function (DUF4238)
MLAQYKKRTGKDLGIDAEKLREIATAVANGSIELEQKSKGWTMKHLFERGMELGEVLAKMRWVLLTPPEGSYYITCDNPVHMNEPTKGNTPKGFTFSEGMQLFFPLAPNRLLYGDFKGTKHETGTVKADMVATVNRRIIEQTSEQVYASYRSDALQKELDEVFKTRAPLIPTLPNDMLDK